MLFDHWIHVLEHELTHESRFKIMILEVWLEPNAYNQKLHKSEKGNIKGIAAISIYMLCQQNP